MRTYDARYHERDGFSYCELIFVDSKGERKECSQLEKFYLFSLLSFGFNGKVEMIKENKCGCWN